MANGIFKSNPTPDSTSGMSAKEILARATGKKSGSDLTEADIDKLISTAGVNERDAKRIRRGARQFLSSGLDYRLTDDGGFNVVTPDEKGLTKASRKTGDVKGFNAGDLIGLGRNVSTLMGLAHRFKDQPKDQPSISETPTEKPIDTDKQLDPFGKVLRDAAARRQTSGKPAKSTAAKKTATMTADDILRKQKESGLNEKLDAFSKKYNPKYEKGLSREEFMGMREGFRTFLMENAGKTPNVERIEELVNRFSDDIDALPAKGSMEDIFNMHAQGALEPEYAGRPYIGTTLKQRSSLGVGDIVEGYGIAKTLLNPAFYKSGYDAVRGLATGRYTANPATLAREAFEKSKGVVSPQTFQRAAKSATFKPTPVKTSFLEKMVPSIKNVKFPKVEKIAEVFKGTSPRSKAIKEASARMAEGFKKGGKIKPSMLMRGADGIKVDPSLAPEKEITDAPFTDDNLQMILSRAKANQLIAADAPGAEVIPPRRGKSVGRFASRNSSSELFNENTGLEKAGTVAKYALPFIGEALGRRQLDKIKPMKYSSVDLMTGSVTDLPRPNFKLRYREPAGTDLQSREGSQKFGDAVEREMETNFNIQNSLSKIQQREGVLNRTNQGKMFNAQRLMQVDAFNSNLKAGVAGAKASSVTEPFVAAQQHLAGDIASNTYLKGSKQTALASEIIKHPEKFGGIGSDQYQQAIKFLSGSRGMKFKIS